MTDRLYYTDPYLQAFDATIARVERRDDRLVVTLDRTAFYPTSGGQPFDTGTPRPAARRRRRRRRRRLDRARRTGTTRTLALRTGDAVRGEIDWARRFDHMQQHSGQHVLSAAFDKLFGVRTVSFHLGAAVSTIDLAREMSPAEIAAAEAEANRIVWEDRPVAIRFATAEEAARLPLRKEPARGGTLRLIDVDGFDLSACGGTHVARTGGIGVIAVASWERFKGGQRLEFLCGGRALNGYRTLRDAMTASVRLLSVLPEELPAAIERLQADAKEQKRSMVALQGDLARYRAEELAAGAEEVRLADSYRCVPPGRSRRRRRCERTEGAGDRNCRQAWLPRRARVLVNACARRCRAVAGRQPFGPAATDVADGTVRRTWRRQTGIRARRRASLRRRDPERRSRRDGDRAPRRRR